MALTRNKPRAYSNIARSNTLALVAATAVAEGAAIGIQASTGRARALVAGDLFAGFAAAAATSVGDVTGASPTNVRLHVEGEVLLTIAGVTAASIGASVFAADDDTFALTGSSLVGEILRVQAGQAVVGFSGGRARMSSAQLAASQALVSGDRNTLAIVGDSFCARWRVSSAGAVDYRPQGFLMWALAYCGQRMTVVSDQSVGGAWVSQGGSVTPLIQQIDVAVASGARNLLLMGGINDFSNGVSLATVQAAFAYIIGKARAAGMRVWWCTQPQFNSAGGGYTVARQGAFFALNDWIRSLCASQAQTAGGIVCIDVAAKVMNPASTTGNWLSGYVQSDNLHPTNVGAMAMGKEVARVWSLYVPEAPCLLSSAADDTAFSTASTNILTNGLFVNGTPTGTGWTQSVTGAGSNTPSIQARSDGYGNDQQQIAVFSANNDSVVLTSGDLKANVALGDILTASCELSLASMSATRTIRAQLTMTGTLGSKVMSWGQLDSSVDIAMTDATGSWTVKLEPVQYTADLGTLTAVTFAIRAFGTGSGGVTLKIGRAGVRKLVPYAV